MSGVHRVLEEDLARSTEGAEGASQRSEVSRRQIRLQGMARGFDFNLSATERI